MLLELLHTELLVLGAQLRVELCLGMVREGESDLNAGLLSTQGHCCRQVIDNTLVEVALVNEHNGLGSD